MLLSWFPNMLPGDLNGKQMEFFSVLHQKIPGYLEVRLNCTFKKQTTPGSDEEHNVRGAGRASPLLHSVRGCRVCSLQKQPALLAVVEEEWGPKTPTTSSPLWGGLVPEAVLPLMGAQGLKMASPGVGTKNSFCSSLPLVQHLASSYYEK